MWIYLYLHNVSLNFFFCYGGIPVYEECDIVGYLYMRNVTQPRAKDATTKQTDTTETCVGKKM